MPISLTVKRRLAQTVAAVLLTSNVAGVSMGSACIPVLWCEACALSWLGCPIGLMAAAIAFHEIPWLILAIVLGSAVVVGRWFCGWICPTGFIQDLLFKIPGRKFTLPPWARFIKYGVLLFSVVAVAWFWGRDHVLSFCKWCPTATASVAVPEAIRYGGLAFDWDLVRWVILAAVILLAVLIQRSFCKVLCPVGALVALVSRFSWLAVSMDTGQCKSCKVCDRQCPMDVKVEAKKHTDGKINRDAECIGCLTCETVCTKSAISNNSRLLKKGDA